MGFGGDQTVTQKTELDPVQQLYLYGPYGLDEEFLQQQRDRTAQRNAFRADMAAPTPAPTAALPGLRNGGIATLPANGMRPQAIPNLGNRNNAYTAAMMARQGYQTGGMIQGPGTGTSDSIPARIYQNGRPVSEARLSDGEVVMTGPSRHCGAAVPSRTCVLQRRRACRRFERMA